MRPRWGDLLGEICGRDLEPLSDSSGVSSDATARSAHSPAQLRVLSARDRPILPSDVSRKRVPRGCAALVVPRAIARRKQRDQTVCAARVRRCGNLRSRGVDTIRDLPYPGWCIHERRLRGAAARLFVRGVRATTRVRALNCVTSFSCDFLTTTCIFTLIAS